MKPPLRQIPRASADHQNAKGPAEAATSPSHGSTIPEKDTEMNRTDDIMSPPVVTSDNRDPLLETIRAFQCGCDHFNRLADATSDDRQWDEFESYTFGPPLAKLQQWAEPAKSMEGAIAALQISLLDSGGVNGSEAQDRMVKAALGYLESEYPATATVGPPVVGLEDIQADMGRLTGLLEAIDNEVYDIRLADPKPNDMKKIGRVQHLASIAVHFAQHVNEEIEAHIVGARQ